MYKLYIPVRELRIKMSKWREMAMLIEMITLRGYQLCMRSGMVVPRIREEKVEKYSNAQCDDYLAGVPVVYEEWDGGAQVGEEKVE